MQREPSPEQLWETFLSLCAELGREIGCLAAADTPTQRRLSLQRIGSVRARRDAVSAAYRSARAQQLGHPQCGGGVAPK